MPTYSYPREIASTTIVGSGPAPSDQVVCTCRSPRYARIHSGCDPSVARASASVRNPVRVGGGVGGSMSEASQSSMRRAIQGPTRLSSVSLRPLSRTAAASSSHCHNAARAARRSARWRCSDSFSDARERSSAMSPFFSDTTLRGEELAHLPVALREHVVRAADIVDVERWPRDELRQARLEGGHAFRTAIWADHDDDAPTGRPLDLAHESSPESALA